MFGRCKIGLALGGGAARGLSHIGVLEAFEQNGISIDCIAGTSMGAIIGAMYAVQPDAAAVKRKFISFLASKAFQESRFDFMAQKDLEQTGIFNRLSHFARKSLFYTLLMTRRSFIEQETTSENFAILIEDVLLEETVIPFCTSSLDLISGEEFVFCEGSLRLAVAASCAIPGLLPPVEINGRFLVDGSWINPVPVRSARRLGADLVIAVNVNSDLDPYQEPVSAIGVVTRSETVTRWALGNRLCREADLVLCPEAGDNHWADFSLVEDAVDSGRIAVEQYLPELRRLIAKKRRQVLFSLSK